MAGMLYLVPTPIGNLGDISARCREILAQADFIAAEDTRVTLRLLNFLEIKKPLVSYYEHNQSARGKQLLERMQAGEVCALVSDAGSPCHLRPRRGPGPAVRRGGHCRLRHTRSLRRHHGLEHLRPAHRPLHL